MKKIFNSLNLTFRDKRYLISFVLLVFLITYIYYLAIERTSGVNVFLHVNSTLYVFLQIFFSLINAILGALSIVSIIKLMMIQKELGKLSIIQSSFSLLVSVGTTGCYICGSILIPFIGISSSIAALPFGGLEIKIISSLITIISLYDLSIKILGLCLIEKKFLIKMDIGTDLKLTSNQLRNYRSLFITTFLIILMFSLPLIESNFSFRINPPDRQCTIHTN